jgi:hypothetical protein
MMGGNVLGGSEHWDTPYGELGGIDDPLVTLRMGKASLVAVNPRTPPLEGLEGLTTSWLF